MARILGVDIAGEVNRAMGSLLLDVTLTERTVGTRTAGSLSAGTNPTTTTYSGKGFVDDYDEGQVDGTLVVSGDRRVVVLGASITPAATPEPGWRVTIDGGSYEVVRVKTDPAEAQFELQARRV